LYEGLLPRAQCHLRQEEFGMVLMRGNKVVPLASQDVPVLMACDGAHTLSEIETQFGKRGLRVIVGLQQRGLVEFLDRAPLAA
jgi:hypothetical protein